MARTPEGNAKQDIKDWLAARNIWYFMPRQSGYGKRGIPDFICCYRGRLIGIEAKSAHGEPSAWQDRCHVEIRKNGGVVIIAKAPTHLISLEDGFRAYS